MNRSIVITRYARALVKFVRDNGHGDIVCSEAETLVKTLHAVPDLQRMVTAADDVVTPFEKKKLLQSALGNKMSADLSRFLTLLNRNGRMPLVLDILRDFTDMYHRSVGVRKAHLTTASDMVKQKTGDEVIIEVDVDSSLIGGFVFDIDDYLVDASVKRQLDIIREQFIERNRRII